MASFVEDFMQGVMAHGELAEHHKQFQDAEEMEIIKDKLCAFFKFKLDGSRFYIGRSMTEVHRNLGITNELFDQMLQIFLTSLKKQKKPKVFQAFYKRILALKSEICFPPALVSPAAEIQRE